MDAQSTSVILEIQCDIARVTLNRAATLNALSLDVAERFLEVVREIESNELIRVVIINGEGRAFCSGGDLKYLDGASSDATRSLIDPLHDAIELLTKLPIPVVACVHGGVSGAGLSLALACDFILAATGTRFNFAYTGIGATPDASATWHLPRLVGLNKSLEMLMLNEPFDADKALELHLINQVHPKEQLETACTALAQRLAKSATLALGRTKTLLRGSLQRTLKEQLDSERESFCASTQSHDFNAGIKAFLNKCTPAFKGS